MDGQPAKAEGRRPILRPDKEVLDLLRDYGLRGYSAAECARRLDVHRDTMRRFLLREPLAGDAFEAGKAERRALLRKGPAARAGLPAPETPKPGQICPTCGQRAGETDNAIVLTPAFLADARRRFDDIIDRHLAARSAEDGDGDDESGTDRAETGRQPGSG